MSIAMAKRKKKKDKKRSSRRMKKCTYCKGMHYSSKAYNACKRRHTVENWPK